MKTVIIFGGSGYVGRNIVRRLAKKGNKIIIPYHSSANEPKLRLLGKLGQITVFKFNNIEDPRVTNALKNADIIINLKTMWDQKRLSFSEGIFEFNKGLIDFISSFDKKKMFIFFSGIGLDPEISSKRSNAISNSEEYIQQNVLNYVIVRPGIIIGSGDKFVTSLVPLIKYFFVVPLFGKGMSKFQPVYVDDIAKAVEKILDNTSRQDIFELVGPEIFTYREFYSFIANSMNLRRIYFHVPFFLLKIGVFFLNLLSINILNQEQLKLFQNDNLPRKTGKNFTELNFKPQSIKEIMKLYIKNIG